MVPDLPIDTLFIVGLLVASFVGKILEGRAKKTKESKNADKPSPQKKDRPIGDKIPQEKGLGQLLREAFGEVVEPKQQEPLEPLSVDQLPIKKKTDTIVKQINKSESVYSLAPSTTKENRETKTTRKWLKSEGLVSKGSLRRAIVLKEILDQPVGLRKTLF